VSTESGPGRYDVIGRTYSAQRQADPRLAALVAAAVGESSSVVNVGAGTGSYEPTWPGVVAVEPSSVMLAQRPPAAAPAVQAQAEALPFPDGAFDAALAVLTIQHWTDQRQGLEECARVARERVVIFTWDPESEGFWLVQEYLPEVIERDRRRFPRMGALAAVLGTIDVQPVPIPADCADGFLGAFWQRPEAYLDLAVRSSMSSLGGIGAADDRIERLRRDLASGDWERRHGDLLGRAELDIGYRLVVATPQSRFGAGFSVQKPGGPSPSPSRIA
jgi:SAM-dependent methyltransferase